MIKVVDLDRIESISADDFLSSYYHRNYPVIIKDSSFNESEFSKWNAQLFSEKWGELTVPVQKYGPGKNHLPHFKEDRGFEKISVKEFFRRDKENFETKKESLLMGKLSVSLFPGMNLSFKLPSFLPRNFFDHKVWVYSQNSVTPMHFDVMDTFLVQGEGQKTVYFFEPGIKGLYPFDFFSKSAHFSKIDATNIDIEKYPLLKNKTMYVGTLSKGEILYIPFGWWHQLTGDGEMNFALAYWYYPSMKKAIRYFFQGLRLWRIAFMRWLLRYPI